MFAARSTRLVGVLAGVALAAGTLAACSSSASPGPSASTSPSATSGHSSTSTGAAAPSTSGTSGGATSGSASGGATSGSATSGGSGTSALSDCAESQLRASIDPRTVSGSSTTGAHADYAIIVDFENTSSSSCLMHGYPGAALVGPNGKQVKQAKRTIRGRLLGLPVGQNTEPTVVLEPGAYASAGLEGVNEQEQGAAQAGCDNAFYHRILVTPPNTSTPVPFDHTWPLCFAFTVHPTNIEKNPPK